MVAGRFSRLVRQSTFVLLVTAAVAGAIQALVSTGWLSDLELEAHDRVVRWSRPAALPAAEVALVWITEADVQRYGHPFSDGLMADVVDRLLAHEPSVVGLDVYRDRAVPPGTPRLRELLSAHPNVVIVNKLEAPDQAGVGAPDYLGDQQVGFSDMPLDQDGIVRRTLLMMWDDAGRAHLAFSLLVALHHLSAEGISLRPAPGDPTLVRLGATTLPALTPEFGGYVRMDAGGYQLMLDQRRRIGDVPQFTLDELLGDEPGVEAVRGRAVLLATGSSSVKDMFHTPRERAVFGGALHALSVDQLLRFARGASAPLESLAGWQEGLWLVLWCLLGSGLGMAIRSPVLTALAGLAGLLGLSGLAVVAQQGGLWVTLAAPALGWTAALGLGVALRTREEHIEKDQVLRLFGQFVSAKIVREVWAHRSEFMDGARPRPQRATITALHCDLSGFVKATATLPPDDVMRWVGEFMDHMADLVEQHGGVVSDFTGDGLMASFGVPLVRRSEAAIRQDAGNAVRCALAMSRRMAELNHRWRDAGLPEARLRVGVCTGDAVVGTYGSRERLKYASVGLAVNAAARLEAHDKEGFYAEGAGNRVLVAESTWRRLVPAVAGRCLGLVQLRGLPEATPVYRVFDTPEDRHESTMLAADRRTLSVVGERGPGGRAD